MCLRTVCKMQIQDLVERLGPNSKCDKIEKYVSTASSWREQKCMPSSSRTLQNFCRVACAGGGNAEYAAVHEGHAMRVPDALSLRDAAAIPEVWLTAYQLLHFVGEKWTRGFPQCITGQIFC